MGSRFPPSVLTKIASCLAKEGVEALTNLLVCSPVGVLAVLHPETLHVARLDKCHCFSWWSDPISWWYHFYQKCLRAKNSYALYVYCLRLAFNVGEIQAALYILNDIKDIYPMVKLSFIIMSWCAGQDCEEVYKEFRANHQFEEVEKMGSDLIYHIDSIDPKNLNTFGHTWNFGDYPDCWEQYPGLYHDSSERNMDCVFYYLSKEICGMT